MQDIQSSLRTSETAAWDPIETYGISSPRSMDLKFLCTTRGLFGQVPKPIARAAKVRIATRSLGESIVSRLGALACNSDRCGRRSEASLHSRRVAG